MLSIAPLTRKGCAMATKEIDGLLQFKDKNGDVNIVYPVTKAENVEGLFGENGKIPSDQLPDMDYLPLAGGTMTGNISFTYTGELNDTERTVDIGGLVLSGGMGGSYINLGNGITTITSDLSETALAVGLMENNVQDAIGFIISNSSAMNQMYGTTTGINTTSDINMSGHSITNLKAPTSNTDATNKEYVDGEIESVIPTGVIVMWSGSTSSVPTGWALCNGQNGTPDLRDRFIVGAGNSYSVGSKGGADSVTLTTSQMPSHAHSLNVNSFNVKINFDSGVERASDKGTNISGTHNTIAEAGSGSQYGIRIGSTASYDNGYAVSDLTHASTIDASISNSGSDQSHENRPPYYALAFIMKL